MKKIIILIIIIALGVFIYQQNEKSEQTVNVQGEAHEQNNDDQDKTDTTVSFDQSSYMVSAEDTVIKWYGEMVGIKSHEGTFSVKDGSTIAVDEAGSMTGIIVIDMNSITSDSEQLNGHLLSPDFFDAEQYPEAVLTITSYDPEQKVVVADLQMKGISESVMIPVSFAENESEIIGTGAFEIDRSRWNIQYGSSTFFDDLGDQVIGDEVDIEFTIVLEK
jgi:polyisoprenoid-binding protein YceI